ncbi:MAG TPA: MgtC/SapB family protein [Candidatus Acetothermia bacterium]|nr:MgtC/SapB family protein [Candidatus Acetothermia bacterium]
MAYGVILLKLAVAAVLGGLIGLERETHGRPAGLRTNVLVCVGAASIMVVARAASSGVVDPGRAMAGVMTGIGFLGAGAIIKMGNIVRGLTTAACIWLVAALGIAVGQGLYALALTTTALALLVLVVVDRFIHITSVSYHTVILKAEGEALSELVRTCRDRLRDQGLRVLASEVKAQADGTAELTFHVRKRGILDEASLVQILLAVPGVRTASWGAFRS